MGFNGLTCQWMTGVLANPMKPSITALLFLRIWASTCKAASPPTSRSNWAGMTACTSNLSKKRLLDIGLAQNNVSGDNIRSVSLSVSLAQGAVGSSSRVS